MAAGSKLISSKIGAYDPVRSRRIAPVTQWTGTEGTGHSPVAILKLTSYLPEHGTLDV
jgi:hypothetical protein